MFNVYYSNQITEQKNLLTAILARDPNPDPFSKETVLVQSLGMAQWLQMQIASEIGVSGNVEFPYPTSFLWQQYRVLFPDLPKENPFARSAMQWRLMRLIPQFLDQPNFDALAHYLHTNDQLRLYQLAEKIADLFDQYLVYRPQWLVQWEQGRTQAVVDEIVQAVSFKQKNADDIAVNVAWQSRLWNELVADIKQDSDEMIFNTSHRAYLQQRYFDKLDNLTNAEKARLPKRIFVFGISSLPHSQLAVLKKFSEHCDIHLFFTNPSLAFWANDREDKILEKLALKQQLSEAELADLFAEQGNPLLTTWGKQAKEFLNLLIEEGIQDISLYDEFEDENLPLLTQIKKAILYSEHQSDFNFIEQDNSIQIHACHSKMREVEVLHNQLLWLFENNPDLSPKDIIVMSADIDSYAPYINAVFSRYERNDPRSIPFTLSDQKISYIDPIIASFLQLLTIKENKFSAEEILDLFDISAIRENYQFSEQDIQTLREWIKSSGIRVGLNIENPEWKNYNSWENGLNRLLLGTSLKAENNVWQNVLAFDECYGLASELAGNLAKFIDHLTAWHRFICQPQTLSHWKEKLDELITQLYHEDEQSIDAIFTLKQAVSTLVEQIEQSHFEQAINIDVIAECLAAQLSEQRSNLNFLVGKVNFCTLLPMRAIPFKVVCLLGMNEGEFPRQQTVNSFDLMQYASQKGDRARRDDDRYLFLEALLSAQQILYISYIGQSLTSSQEKLPSVLVSQFVDYLTANLPEVQHSKLIIKHPMTVFSPNNFINGKVAYDKEWLEMKNNQATSQSFLQKLTRDENEIATEIPLHQFIAYLQEPLKYFFQQQLGVRFEKNEDKIEETEIFQLSGLEKYNLLDDLIQVEDEQIALFFENEKLKGNLPACYFAEINKQQLIEHIQLLREALSDYLSQEKTVEDIDYSFILAEKKYQLIGNIPHRFDNEIILWRVGGLRDKDIIQAWVYYLLLKAKNSPINSLCFYYREAEKVKYLSFNGISEEQAKEILNGYLQDYLASQIELKWAITHDIQSYFKALKNSENLETNATDLCRNTIELSKDPYIQRVLSQTELINSGEISNRTETWFRVMLDSME
ncbi:MULTISPECIES: exodeoxyribonuclease V subunit gamma [Glaesserella]|uniref:RecBCD enzyme subunit RecC n=1 Tax=Glaesserella australis TaxID=2094024 RepID=A0A328BX75_9PAST|nr:MULTISPECIES: exodeoxyribonuclease V subunit gamma [Glaesserella]AUI66589.1 exodeoxyribonuclease V subunit gamma [Glaesserella sp. 15-184]RAL18763.1 exodeoxyribonuclease V subunit gamma [Glaesserella australis]